MFNHKQINSQKSFRNLQNTNFHPFMISLETQIFCPHCNTEYKDNNLPRTLTMCGHTYCESCISKMIKQNFAQSTSNNGYPYYVQCPEDGAKRYVINDELKVFPKNLALIKVIEAKKVNSSFRGESLNLSKIVQKQEIQQDEETSDLILAIEESKNQQNCKDRMNQDPEVIQNKNNRGPPTKDQPKSAKQISEKTQQQKQQDELCLLHQKPLEIVCIRDKKKICSKCALFGSHKGHEFKSVQQLQNQKNQCYLSILQIFKQKQEIQQRMSNQETESGLIEILDKKKNLMEGEIRQQFRKLRQEITKQEKIVFKKLQQTYKNTQKKIHALLQVEETSLQKFSDWEVDSYKLLKVLEEPELQAKIDALYSKQKRNGKILQKGNQILSEIQEQQKNLVNRVEQILTHLQCKKSKKIFDFIPEFIEIIESPPQKIQIQSLKSLQNQNNIGISIPLFDNGSKQSVQLNDCSIIEGFNQKFNLVDGSPLLEQSLLEDKDETVGSETSRNNVNQFGYECSGRIPLRPNSSIINKNYQEDSISCSFIHLELESAKKNPIKTAAKPFKDEDQDFFLQNSRVSSILTSRPSMILKKQNGERPNKKKLKSIKISQKYEKMLQAIYNNTADTIDLTNAQVGDQSMLQICEFIKFSKARTIKLIRNKLTDSGVEKMLPALSNAQILNLSQNNLTEAVIDIFIKHRHGYLSGLKNLILSQNKIIERKHKAKIDQLRAMNIVVSV